MTSVLLNFEKSDQIKHYIFLWDIVQTKHFEDEEKTDLWFATENPLLGGISPIEMIVNGRGDKLEKFIEGQLLGLCP